MTLAEIRKKNAERRQLMASRSNNMLYMKLPNDGDTVVVRVVPPFNGFDRPVKTMQQEIKLKSHFRVQIIADFNAESKLPLSNPRLELTANDVRNLKIENARIWTTPNIAAQRILKEIDKGHSFLQIQRDGKPQSTSTTYNVLNAQQIDDEDWEYLFPNMSKADLAKLQSEEKWEDMPEEELHRLETLGVKENDQQ